MMGEFTDFTDYGYMQVVVDLALYLIPVALILMAVIGVINYRRAKRLGIVQRNIEDVKKEVIDQMALLDWKKAMVVGVRWYHAWVFIKECKYDMMGLVKLLTETGLKIELVQEVEGVTDSIEISGITDIEFREKMYDLHKKTFGVVYSNQFM